MPGTTYPTVNEDARNRAWRTIVQNVLVDVVGAVVVALVAYLSTDIQWTGEYWLAAAALAGRTAVLALVSYIGRKVVPPAVSR